MARCHECGRVVDEDELVALPARDPDTDTGEPKADAGEPGAGAGEPKSATGVPSPEEPNRCPACGTAVGPEDDTEDQEGRVRPPWHFKVLVVGTVVYLGYRLYQGIGWLIHHA